MRGNLAKEAFNAVIDSNEKGTKISRNLAEQIASAMKDWAISKGATHYTHGFNL